MINNAHSVDVIAKNISKTLKVFKVPHELEILNGYSCISVHNIDSENTDEENGLFLWIRVMPTGKLESTCIVELANIRIPLQYRRKGILQNMYDRLNKCKYVSEIRIISVCTEEMKQWCLKNSLKEYVLNCYR